MFIVSYRPFRIVDILPPLFLLFALGDPVCGFVFDGARAHRQLYGFTDNFAKICLLYEYIIIPSEKQAPPAPLSD